MSLPRSEGSGPDRRKIRVAILEDSHIAIMGLTAVLETEGDIEVVGASEKPEELLALIEEHDSDLAIIDLKIRGRFDVGINAIERVKSRFPDVKCMVVTGYRDLWLFLDAYNAGAEAFVPKDADINQQEPLPDIVRRVVAGGRAYDSDLLSQMIPYLDTSRLPITSEAVKSRELNLTSRELEVLALLVDRAGNPDIAERLFISTNTVKRHVSSILHKLNVPDRHQAALLAVSLGLVRAPPVEE